MPDQTPEPLQSDAALAELRARLAADGTLAPVPEELAPLCPVCLCGVVDDVADLDDGSLIHGECMPVDVMIGQINTERDESARLRARIAELEAEQGKVRDFINERTMYVDALKSDTTGGDDYHRWSGGAEARRQLAGRLGWTVPHEHGDKTSPIVGTGTGTRPAAPQSDPAGYVVVTRNAEGGLHRPATVWPTLEQA
ncbi:hypothetical protein, partial [Nocardia africana]